MNAHWTAPWLLAALVATWGATTMAFAQTTYRGYEAPPYTVEARDGPVELRDYAPFTVAEVTVSGRRGPAIQTGFRILAGYIFGRNQTPAGASEKIAMTVPVTQAKAEEGWVIRFMMPAGKRLDALPAPENAAVRLTRTAPERMIVMRFSGRATTRALTEQAERLAAYARANDLEITGAPRFMFYDDPFTLPWRRRNEVGLVLAD
ncbi:hypothetical protein Ga0609869_000950 [Rhodovulum iodosum]|uniref:Heme-binding protein n=1 Tax=Rhodovulum iodosum TaxID=68291 RepID=A0ABV3XQJ4_9RHOB|nr:heme-binding protein [Rhodovulum robiginosum]RSK32968.1 heme-binding protein [Rhodovulum robiginosum]